jgi:hypothetical protein
MADIATVNTSDKTLLPAPRQGYRRRSNIGSNWTDVRLGIFFTVVPSGNDDAACVTETVVDNGFPDWFTFGLKDSSASAPYTAGTRFVGIRQWQNFRITTDNSAGAGEMIHSGLLSVATAGSGAAELALFGFSMNPRFPQYSAGTVNGFWGLKMVVNNAGLSSQSIRLHTNMTGTTAIADVSKTNLRTNLLGSFTDCGGDVAFNESGAALTLPDTLWIRLPTFNNRIRITTYGVLKVS